MIHLYRWSPKDGQVRGARAEIDAHEVGFNAAALLRPMTGEAVPRFAYCHTLCLAPSPAVASNHSFVAWLARVLGS